MNTKRITYFAAAIALTGLFASCEHDEIYQELDFSVQLAASNTYRVGDPVVFDFGGNAHFITAWSGDTGHEYQYRDRTSVALTEIESCELEIQINQQYGAATPLPNNLDMLVGNKFTGLTRDAAVDRPRVEAIAANGYADWEKLVFSPNRSRIWESYTYDVKAYADNFSFGFHFFHDPALAMRTYWIEPKITVKLKGYESQLYKYSNLSFVPFSTRSKHSANPYIQNQSGNGWIKLQGTAGANSSAPIVFMGFNVAATEGPIDQWLFSAPLKLNSITPDTGQNIKGVTDELGRYEHTYTTPGTYTATFIVSTGNYMGQSAQVVHNVTFTVMEKIN